MKTVTTRVKCPLLSVERFACDNLMLETVVKSGESYYSCDRPSQIYCDDRGWCPLRYHDLWRTPEARSFRNSYILQKPRGIW